MPTVGIPQAQECLYDKARGHGGGYGGYGIGPPYGGDLQNRTLNRTLYARLNRTVPYPYRIDRISWREAGRGWPENQKRASGKPKFWEFFQKFQSKILHRLDVSRTYNMRPRGSRTPGSFSPRPLPHLSQSSDLKIVGRPGGRPPLPPPCPIEAHLPGPDPRQARGLPTPASPHNTCHEGLLDPFI